MFVYNKKFLSPQISAQSSRARSVKVVYRKVYGENGCANVAKVEATDVIWKRAGDSPILPVLITLSSARISCAYSLPNSPKYPADGIQLQIEEEA